MVRKHFEVKKVSRNLFREGPRLFAEVDNEIDDILGSNALRKDCHATEKQKQNRKLFLL